MGIVVRRDDVAPRSCAVRRAVRELKVRQDDLTALCNPACSLLMEPYVHVPPLTICGWADH